MRGAGLVAAAAMMALAAQPAHAAGDDAVTRANGIAYESSMKCFVANVRAMGLRQRVGDTAQAAYYDAKSKRAFDTAVRLGTTLDHSRDEIERDFSSAQIRELPEMIRDPAYFRDAIATCKAMGLM